jgi:hypothetical protein
MDGSIGKLIDVVAQRPVLGLLGLALGGGLFLQSLPSPLGLELEGDAATVGYVVGAIVYLCAGGAAGLFLGWSIGAARGAFNDNRAQAREQQKREAAERERAAKLERLVSRIKGLSPDAKNALNYAVLVDPSGTNMIDDVSPPVALELEQAGLGERMGPMFSLKRETYDVVLNAPELVSLKR